MVYHIKTLWAWSDLNPNVSVDVAKVSGDLTPQFAYNSCFIRDIVFTFVVLKIVVMK